MWARIDDGLPDHPKIVLAGRALGKNGRLIAVGFFTTAVCWSAKHLTDGLLPVVVLESFDAINPLAIADAFATVGLFEVEAKGYRIHDWTEWNPSAAEVKKRRHDDVARKRRGRGNGATSQ